MTETIHLPYLEPWDWQQFHRHFSLRLLPGVERLDLRGYARTLRLGDARGWLGVSAAHDRPALELTLSDSLRHASQPLVARVRKMFDLDADPQVIAAHFAGDPALGPLVSAQPGLRLPAAYDPFEQAVRAVVGQQVTVKAAVTITRRLVERLRRAVGTGSDRVGGAVSHRAGDRRRPAGEHRHAGQARSGAAPPGRRGGRGRVAPACGGWRRYAGPSAVRAARHRPLDGRIHRAARFWRGGRLSQCRSGFCSRRRFGERMA